MYFNGGKEVLHKLGCLKVNVDTNSMWSSSLILKQ